MNTEHDNDATKFFETDIDDTDAGASTGYQRGTVGGAADLARKLRSLL